MTIESRSLHAVCVQAQSAMPVLEQELNKADAMLGDGDTGGMLTRVIGELAAQPITDEPDLGAAFSKLGRAAASATGSSLGTLIATALLAISKQVRGKSGVPDSEIGPLLIIARDAMLARGGSKLGDKTVIDSLDAVAVALSSTGLSAGELKQTARDAAAKALDDFRDRPCQIGRARMYADKSRGLDDPGMLAFARLTIAIAG